MAKQKPKKFTKKNILQLNMIYIVFIFVFVLLGIRIFYLQQVKGEEYTQKTMKQQNLVSLSIPYRRGNITDRNGTLIATSEKVYNLIYDCKVINSSDDYADPTIQALCSCFPELDENDLRDKLETMKNSSYVVLFKQMEYDEVKPFIELLEDSERNKNVKGVWLEEEYKRYYPYHTFACHLLGFTGNGNNGSYGIEEYYNKELNGTNGRKYQYVDAEGERETVVKDADNGYNLTTTIDYNLQTIVERCIKDFNDQHVNEAREGNGADKIAVMIQDPNSGEILAEAVYPNFDLNAPLDVTKSGILTAQALSAEQADAMSDQEKTALMTPLWKNFCITDTFEPGSTKKPFTVAAGLETGKINGNETYVCDGVERVDIYDIHCVNRQGHGSETISQAIMNSCNDVLMQISRSIGVETFIRYQDIWGFGKKTNIDLPAEVNCASLVYTAQTMHETELATCSFGQGFNVTMTQLMSAFCSLINGGHYYQPHVVKKITDSKGSTIKNIEPYLVRKTISKETSEQIKTYLKETAMQGTAHTAVVPGYSMGGKTGTAEKLPRGNKQYLVSFIGYVPADNPQLAIYVVVDRPNVADQAHSTFAQEIARNILTEALPYMGIFPDVEIEQPIGAGDASVQAGETSNDDANQQPAEQTPNEDPNQQPTNDPNQPFEDDDSVFQDNMPFPLLDN